MGKNRMAKAWVVTSGEYSDYIVEAVCSTKKKAEEYIAKYGDPADSTVRWEEMELDPELPETLYYELMFREDGVVSLMGHRTCPDPEELVGWIEPRLKGDWLRWATVVEARTAKEAKIMAKESFLKAKAKLERVLAKGRVEEEGLDNSGLSMVD